MKLSFLDQKTYECKTMQLATNSSFFACFVLCLFQFEKFNDRSLKSLWFFIFDLSKMKKQKWKQKFQATVTTVQMMLITVCKVGGKLHLIRWRLFLLPLHGKKDCRQRIKKCRIALILFKCKGDRKRLDRNWHFKLNTPILFHFHFLLSLSHPSIFMQFYVVVVFFSLVNNAQRRKKKASTVSNLLPLNPSYRLLFSLSLSLFVLFYFLGVLL